MSHGSSASTLSNVWAAPIRSRTEVGKLEGRVVGFHSLDQRVHRGAGIGAVGRVHEEPSRPADGEGPDGILRQGVADMQGSPPDAG